jgi:putative membrane protein
MYDWHWYGFGWFYPFMMLIVVLVFFSVVIFPFVRSMMGHDFRGPLFRGQAKRDDEAMAIARRRYANGEISKDEFEEIRRTLS